CPESKSIALHPNHLTTTITLLRLHLENTNSCRNDILRMKVWWISSGIVAEADNSRTNEPLCLFGEKRPGSPTCTTAIFKPQPFGIFQSSINFNYLLNVTDEGFRKLDTMLGKFILKFLNVP